ncbi:MAG: hypothetical protein FWG30_01000 [Eubacteriaceae bacterium]|nr:hypothetical protein [Eubacteriaceae bacterium]
MQSNKNTVFKITAIIGVITILASSIAFAAGSEEFYDHSYGFAIIVPEKFADTVIQTDHGNLIIRFSDPESEMYALLTLTARNLYDEMDPDAIEGYEENDLSLEHEIFIETYQNQPFMVQYMANQANENSGGTVRAKYLQHVNINDITFWVYSFGLLDVSNTEIGEGKIYYTIYKGKSYNITITNKSGSISVFPEIEQSLATLMLGRKVSPAMRYIWIIVSFLNLAFFLLMMWVITRPRKYSRRQMIRREQRALRRAVRKGLPIPQQGLELDTTQLVPVKREKPKLYRFNEADMKEISRSIAYKKLISELDGLLGRNEDSVYEEYDFGLDTDHTAAKYISEAIKESDLESNGPSQAEPEPAAGEIAFEHDESADAEQAGIEPLEPALIETGQQQEPSQEQSSDEGIGLLLNFVEGSPTDKMQDFSYDETLVAFGMQSSDAEGIGVQTQEQRSTSFESAEIESILLSVGAGSMAGSDSGLGDEQTDDAASLMLNEASPAASQASPEPLHMPLEDALSDEETSGALGEDEDALGALGESGDAQALSDMHASDAKANIDADSDSTHSEQEAISESPEPPIGNED